MKPTGHALTIQHTDSSHWLVTCNDIVSSEIEHVSFTIAVPRSSASVKDVQHAAIQGAIAYLQACLNAPDQGI